jgi:general secretion pathway protein E
LDPSDADAVIGHQDELERRLGERLVSHGKIDPAGLERAMRLGSESGERISTLLPKLGLISERELAQELSNALELPLATAEEFPEDQILAEKLSPRFLREARLLPLSENADGLVLAMVDPLNSFALDAIRLIYSGNIHIKVAVPAEIETVMERLYSEEKGKVDEIGDELAEGQDSMEMDVERLRDLASEAPVIRLVNQTITRAVESRASDIHIEPFENKMRVRYRIDGILKDVDAPPSGFRAAIVSRIKIMAKLNIAERRLPQDGRIKIAIRGTPIDLRVSTLPSLHGEGVVLRILDRQGVALDFDTLGITGQAKTTFIRALQRPNGIVLVTGPTGSGKTTTLYTSLVQLNSPEKKIVTVEDPIEYQLEGINQIQVKPNIGLTFANILRSILRHDPDIIMIGEIRDVETAEIAVQAALTGHLVLSTLHTNDAASSITRLLDMGVADYLVTSTLNCVAAQRLVRKLCSHCRIPEKALPELVEQLKLRRFSKNDEIILYRPGGCDHCGGSGYHGRYSVMESLVVTDAIRRSVLQKSEAKQLRKVAVGEGMRTMLDDGLRKAVAGVTTIEEVLRVTRDV